MSELKGKTLILTGASRGIGRALALQLAEAGVNLVLNARDAALLNEVASDCRNLGVRAIALSGSAADSTTASKLVDAALDLGHFHGFIQVAGVLHPGPFLWELSEARFRRSLCRERDSELPDDSLCRPGIIEATAGAWRCSSVPGPRRKSSLALPPTVPPKLRRSTWLDSLRRKLLKLLPSSTGPVWLRPACSNRPERQQAVPLRNCGRPFGASKSGANCSHRKHPRKPSSLSSRPIPVAFMEVWQPGGMGFDGNFEPRPFWRSRRFAELLEHDLADA